MKNALPPGRALSEYDHTAETYYNTDSVVYDDSIFMLKRQENNGNARFLVSDFTGVTCGLKIGEVFPLCLQPRNSCVLSRRNYLPNPGPSCYTVTKKTALPAAAAQRESGLTTYCATDGGGPHGDSTDKEPRKVTASEQKRLKTAKNHQKKSFHVLWDHQVGGSSPSTRTKIG